MTSAPIIVAHGATRRYGYRTIVRDIDLTVEEGDVVTVLGPNGVGKTTLLKMLAGLIRPNQGTVERNGSVYAVMHDTLLYEALTGEENLAFAARLHGGIDSGRVGELLDRVGLARWRDQRVFTYSRGMKQRLSIARALLHDPDVLLLDEPLNALDEQGCTLVLDILNDLRGRSGAAFVVTHQIDRLLPSTSHIGYLIGGGLHGPAPVNGMKVADVTAKYRELIANG